ncbi:hypothetical protein VQ045_12525 [Aurantimonas sp. E1-2-R+4]|uniref:hypothetical protein n=1 Tax=Aurantimonas sp. E1-2-R+4 TaxID=3113714 RepID=UPI002F926761
MTDAELDPLIEASRVEMLRVIDALLALQTSDDLLQAMRESLELSADLETTAFAESRQIYQDLASTGVSADKLLALHLASMRHGAGAVCKTLTEGCCHQAAEMAFDHIAGGEPVGNA